MRASEISIRRRRRHRRKGPLVRSACPALRAGAAPGRPALCGAHGLPHRGHGRGLPHAAGQPRRAQGQAGPLDRPRGLTGRLLENGMQLAVAAVVVCGRGSAGLHAPATLSCNFAAEMCDSGWSRHACAGLICRPITVLHGSCPHCDDEDAHTQCSVLTLTRLRQPLRASEQPRLCTSNRGHWCATRPFDAAVVYVHSEAGSSGVSQICPDSSAWQIFIARIACTSERAA